MCWSVNATHRSLRTRELAYYLCGLDQHQVRRWRSWYRWTILAMLAYAFLVGPRSPSTPATYHRLEY